MTTAEIFANGCQATLFAMWSSRLAYIAAVQDKPVVCVRNDFVGQMPCQFPLHRQWSGASGADQSQAVADAEYVGVNCHPGFAEDYCLDDVGCLATDTGQAFKLFAC